MVGVTVILEVRELHSCSREVDFFWLGSQRIILLWVLIRKHQVSLSKSPFLRGILVKLLLSVSLNM